MVEPAGHDVARRLGQQLGHGLDHGREHLLCVLLDPPRLRVPIDLVAPGLAHGAKALVEQRRLDAGGPLIDSKKKQGLIPIGYARAT